MPAGAQYMDTPLFQDVDVEDLPGAPFPESVLSMVAAAIRDAAGWHVAPMLTETLTIDAEGGHLLTLPSMYIVSVSEVRDVTDPDNPVVLAGWRMARAGMLSRKSCWPCGFGTVEVDLVHGYDECPPALLAVAGDLAQMGMVSAAVSQETSGQESVSYRSAVQAAAGRSPVVASYAIRS